MENAGVRDSEVLRLSGVAKTTFYGLKQAERDPDQETLDAIAKALGVPAPHIGKVLLDQLPDPVEAGPMIREARAILQRAEGLLERPKRADGILGGAAAVNRKKPGERGDSERRRGTG